VDFYNFIVMPAFDLLHQVIGNKVDFMLNGVKENDKQWKKLKELGEPYKMIEH
jgi:hypothetical protein